MNSLADALSRHVAYLQALLENHHIPFQPFQPPLDVNIVNQPSFDSSLNQIVGVVQLARYYKQMLIPEIGMENQVKIVDSRVLIVGCGGLGAILGMYLSGAGVGCLGLVDADTVQISNLHRQIPHLNRINQKKTKSLQESIGMLNPLTKVKLYDCFLPSQTVDFENYDLIIDCTDNPQARYYLNDIALKFSKTLIHGCALGWEGMVTVFTRQSLCYRCLYPECSQQRLTCSQNGVIGTIPAIIGLIMATQALKLLALGRSDLIGSMLIFNGKEMSFRRAKLRGRQKSCRCNSSFDLKQQEYEMYCSKDVVYPQTQFEMDWHESLQAQGLKIDCRAVEQFNVFHSKLFVNFPLDKILKMGKTQAQQLLKGHPSCMILCRRGQKSRVAANHLNKLGVGVKCLSIIGGLQAVLNQQNIELRL